MPHIRVSTTAALTEAKKDNLKSALGKAISLIPGKSETWLMTTIHQEDYMSFKGSSENPLVFAEVSLFGSASDSAYDALTAKLTEVFCSELGVDPAGVYIKYEEISHWGWNGNNF